MSKKKKKSFTQEFLDGSRNIPLVFLMVTTYSNRINKHIPSKFNHRHQDFSKMHKDLYVYCRAFEIGAT